MEYSLRLIPLLPFAGAAFLFLFGRSMRRDFAHIIATTAIAGSFLAALYAFFGALPQVREEGGLHDLVWTWFSSDTFKLDLAFRMDALSGVMCLIITFIGTLIHVYSIGYMSHEKDYARFFAYLNLFCGAMLVLVLGDSLPVLFIGWEGVGLCSYLLIGFWYSEKANADAGKKAFITNRIGDFGFLLGMFLLFEATGTLNVPDILAAAHAKSPALLVTVFSQPKAFWAALFLFIGATGKSAQIPLYVWLPDAMAGPTPVSALIHAATMVTAGVYMVARMGALYLLSPPALAIVALVGALTALFAAIIGFAQNDFKKVLAYSTVSQLGFMFVGVGTAGFSSGVFHLLTHAFFKAGLFLCAGSVMHAMSGSGDITKMGGLRKLVPWTHGVFLVCWLAIIGVPPFSGFFSKDSIIAGAMATDVYGPSLAWVGPLAGGLLMAAALCTAFYMSRLYFLVFTGPCRADEETRHHIHESPAEMVVPLVVLAAGAALSGFLGMPSELLAGAGIHVPNVLADWLEPAVGPELHMSHATEGGAMIGSTIIAFAGLGLAQVFFGGGYREPAKKFAAAVPGFVSLVRDKFRIDELYGLLIIRPIRWIAKGLFLIVDRVLIDQILVGVPVMVVDLLGRLSRSFQPGDAQRYVAVFAIGIASVFYMVTRPPHPEELKVKVDALAVDADAGPGGTGHDLQYFFDFDGDGRADRQGPSPTAHFSYEGSGTYTINVEIRDPRWGTVRNLKKKVTVR
jgi:NADH-quinone oxidoreductase subunit L